MATVYSDEVAVGSYNRIRIQCDYSGTSATLTIQFRRTSGYSTTWRDTAARLIFNGQDKDANYAYTGYVGTDWVTLRPAIYGYTISTGGGTYSWQFTQPAGGVLGCSGTITIPAQGSAPSNGNIANLTVKHNGAELEFSATSVSVSDGGLALDLRRFEICEIPLTTSGIPARIKSFTNGQPITLTMSDSTSHDGGINIIGNHLYYPGICARNSAGLYYYSGMSIVTPCEPASLSVSRLNDTSFTVSYGTVADGGYYTKIIEYSLDGGKSWSAGATVATGTASTGTFIINNLEPDIGYTVQFRISTAAGATNCGSIVLAKAYKLYGPVNGYTERIMKIHGPLNGDSKRIIKLYKSVNGRAKLIFKET